MNIGIAQLLLILIGFAFFFGNLPKFAKDLASGIKIFKEILNK